MDPVFHVGGLESKEVAGGEEGVAVATGAGGELQTCVGAPDCEDAMVDGLRGEIGAGEKFEVGCCEAEDGVH